ncbi:hypothetical protein ABBQ38_001789 [Trebouxia sp. C0009 RCD-2024]
MLVDHPHLPGKQISYAALYKESGQGRYAKFMMSPQDKRHLRSWRVFAQQLLLPVPALLVQTWWYRAGNNWFTMVLKPLRTIYPGVEGHVLAHVSDCNLENTLSYLVLNTARADRGELIQARLLVARYLVQRQVCLFQQAQAQRASKEKILVGMYVYGNIEGLRMDPPLQCKTCYDIANTIEPANLPTMVRSSDPQSEDNSIIRAQEWLAATGTQPVMVHLGMMLTEWALGQAEGAVIKAASLAAQAEQRLCRMVEHFHKLDSLDV